MSAKAPFIIFCAALLAALAALALIDPASGTAKLLPLCPFHSLTGLHCAGCGATRALHELLNGKILQSLAYNPLVLAALPLALYLILAWGLRCFGGPRLPLPKLKLRHIILATLLLIAFGVLRNIPCLSCLAPHKIEKDAKR